MCGEKYHTKLHEDKATLTPSASSASAKEAKVMYTPISSDNSPIQKKKALLSTAMVAIQGPDGHISKARVFWILVQKIRLFLSFLHKC